MVVGFSRRRIILAGNLGIEAIDSRKSIIYRYNDHIRWRLKMRKSAILFLLTTFAAFGFGQIQEMGIPPKHSAKDIIIVFRYDDYSDRSDTNAEIAIFNAFRKHGLRLTVGVIPFPTKGRCIDPSPQESIELSDRKAAILLEAIAAGTVEPAQHGCTHHTTRGRWDGGFTEFDDVDYDTQLQLIKRGKAYLEQRLGQRMEIFIPPFNTYDENTLKALNEAGFRAIAAGRFGPYDKSLHLINFPFTCYTEELKAVVEAARKIDEPQPLIIVMFHDSDFIEVSESRGWTTFEGLEGLMDWVAAQPDVRVLTHGEVLDQIADITADRFAAFQELRGSMRWLPPFLVPLEADIYLPAEKSQALEGSGWIITAVYLFLVFVATFGITFAAGMLLFRGRLLTHVLYLGGVAISLIVTVLGVVYLMYDFKGPLALTMAVGTVLGALPAYLSKLKKFGKA
jgi:peptidoglycan/xylan/chitin deacetylase (PgdA/CDA1 family)